MTAGGTSVAGRVTHPFYSLLKDHGCHEGSLPGIPCEGHHFLIGPLGCGGESHMRIRLGTISQQLHPLLPFLHGRPLQPEVLLY